MFRVEDSSATVPAAAGRPAGASVSAAFDRAAPRYDVMAALNPGYRRHLRDATVGLATRLCAGGAGPGAMTVLDLGCGSGMSTRAIAQALRRRARDGRVRVVGLDASPGMLDRARAKRWRSGVWFVHARAEDLEQVARRERVAQVDGVFAAYLFRNVSDPDSVLRQTFEVLRPGGTLVVQEYSVADSARARRVWSAVCHGVVVPLSRLLGTDPGIYRYLHASVIGFDSVRVFADRVRAAGFVGVAHRTVPGWQHDILHTFRATKPAQTQSPR